ncbi:hypothetical protein [Patulibacter minatonensis]|uniref:hypothetical protein n=1 Tax=Patulibacter minatonensis TaxID=298163 RepID=UPI00047E96A2|nr:hypothetical protein [Patulibacter minatonensis]
MCIQCAAGAMTAVAGASGMRMWLEARFPWLMGPRTKKIVRRSLVGVGLLVAGLLGGSGAAPASATAPSSVTHQRAALVAPVAARSATGR